MCPGPRKPACTKWLIQVHISSTIVASSNNTANQALQFCLSDFNHNVQQASGHNHSVLLVQIYGLPENNNALVAAARVHSVLASEDLFVDLEASDGPHDETLNSLTQVYAWGSGHNGRLGLGLQQDMTVPEMVSDLDGAEILDVACGYDHTLVLIKL